MNFSEHESLCCLAVAVSATKENPRIDVSTLYEASHIVRMFASFEAKQKSAHLYVAFIKRFMNLYEKHESNYDAAVRETLKEFHSIFGADGEGLFEFFLKRFLTEPSLPPLEELNRLNAEAHAIAKKAAQAASVLARHEHASFIARNARTGGVTSLFINCPGTDGKPCGEKKRCDQNTKRYRCKKCGFDAPFQDGKIILNQTTEPPAAT